MVFSYQSPSYNSDRLLPRLKSQVSPLGKKTVIPFMFRVVLTVVMIVIVHMIARFISLSVTNSIKNKNKEKKTNIAPGVVSSVIYWCVFLIGIVLVLSWAGIQVSAMIAVFGSIAFAIVLGIQGTLNDFAAGLMLLATMPFQIGDHIKTGDGVVEGKVVDFSIIYTRIRDKNGGIIVSIPNRMLYGSVIINHTSHDLHTDVLEVSISNTNKNLAHVVKELEASIQQFPGIVEEPRVKVNVVRITPFATVLEIRFTLHSHDYVITGTTNKQAHIMSFIHQRLTELGVELPELSKSEVVCKAYNE